MYYLLAHLLAQHVPARDAYLLELRRQLSAQRRRLPLHLRGTALDAVDPRHVACRLQQCAARFPRKAAVVVRVVGRHKAVVEEEVVVGQARTVAVAHLVRVRVRVRVRVARQARPVAVAHLLSRGDGAQGDELDRAAGRAAHLVRGEV